MFYTVAKKIETIGVGPAEQFPVEPRAVEIGANIGAAREPMRIKRVFVFCALANDLRLREMPDRAGMV